MPTTNATIMNIVLQEFSVYMDPKNEKIIILLIDNAGWHISKELSVPENIRFFPLPPYTPELQPTECSWPLLREPIANAYFDNLDILENTVSKRCKWLIQNPEILKGAVGFKWIQEIESTRD